MPRKRVVRDYAAHAAKTAAKQPRPQRWGKPFQPGQSGNPAGRKKQDERGIQALAREHTAAAINALVLALKSPRERVPAAVALLDRGWGKPVQMIAADPQRPLQIDFQWSDAAPNGAENTPNAHTHTPSVRHIGQQIEAAIVEAVTEDSDDTT
jgi:hypothetical protein